MAAVGTSMIQHLQSQSDARVKIQDQSDDDTSDEINITASRDSCSPRTELDSMKEHQANQAPSLQSSSFSMQNVLKMKTERDSVSPELNQNVFSTDKLLQNTPSYENQIDTSIQSNNQGSEYSPNYSRTSIPTSSPRYDNGDESDYPTASERDLNVDEAFSCCSEDTVLSVGNEAPIPNFNDAQSSTPVQKIVSPRTSPLQNLTSFKHIQTHLNAISQLSQNLNINQPVLLRPNPINPNPLLFLNQTHLLFSGSQVPNPTLDSKIGSLSSRAGLNQANQIGPGNPFNNSGVNLRQFKQPAFSGQILGKSMDDTKKNVCNLNLNSNINNNNNSNSPINLDSVNEESRRDIILNQNCLKFSIDNILKADFGRRITDPLMKRKSSISKSRSTHSSSATSGYSNSDLLTSKEPGTVNDFNVKTAKFFGSGTVQLDKPVSLDTRLSCDADSKVGSGGSGEKNGAIDLSKSDDQNSNQGSSSSAGDGPMAWPAWVYCTRYSDRPSSGRSPRTRRPKKPPGDRSPAADEKRPRTAFSGPQLARLKHEFNENRYLTERRRQQLASELGLAEAQIKIWFQNKRAKIKKASGQRNPLALQLMAQGLYNHSTVPLTREEEELQEMQAREAREKSGQAR